MFPVENFKARLFVQWRNAPFSSQKAPELKRWQDVGPGAAPWGEKSFSVRPRALATGAAAHDEAHKAAPQSRYRALQVVAALRRPRLGREERRDEQRPFRLRKQGLSTRAHSLCSHYMCQLMNVPTHLCFRLGSCAGYHPKIEWPIPPW